MKPDEIILAFERPSRFAAWLRKSGDRHPGIWLRIFKKNSGEKTVTYQEALEVALCFGWIDGLRKTYDEKSWIQRFTPRRKKSIWSKRNTLLAETLIEQKRMRPSGRRAIEEAKADGRWEKAYDSPKNMKVPGDFLRELKKHKKAAEFFTTLNKANQFAIAFRLHTATQEKTRLERMKRIIASLKKKKTLV